MRSSNGQKPAAAYVCFFDEDLDAHHVTFLNDLIGESGDAPFLLNSNGDLVAGGAGSVDGMWLARTELGRSAIVMPDTILTRPNLETLSRRMACFLWKVRDQRVASLVRRAPAVEQQAIWRPRNRRDISMAWLPITSTGQFLERMMPSDVRVVPTGLIALILVGYLVVIGPFDYFTLGYFRLRRFTWLTFPLATVLVAVLCVKVSEAYLSSQNTGGALVVRDVDAKGEVLRENRLQLLFMGTHTRMTHDLKNEVFTPLDQQRLTLNDPLTP